MAGRDRIKVACVGNSVTYGYGLKDRAHDAYPVRLQAMLGDKYEVRNFGHSGATLLTQGHNPYVKLPEFRAALDFKADLVVIHLGLNDTDPRNWPHHADEFIPNYRALIDSFRVANPKAKIWICLMTPIFHDHPRFDSGTRLWHGLIQQRIRQIAATDNVGLIDLYTPLHSHPDLFPDALHPNPEGALILAKTVFSGLTGNYGGLQLPATYGNSMVLQRQRPIRIQGTANAGEKVSVNFHGRKADAVTDNFGQWSVSFPAEEAGGPYKLQVKARSGEKTLSDVWVGEVWLCSGQSNMELKLSQVLTGKEDIAAADTCSRLHFYDMPSIVPTYAMVWDSARLDSINHLQYVLPGNWQRANSKAAAHFSAIAFNFGRMLADSLGCHVGLISNAVGGSCTENWIDRATLEKEFPAILRNWKHNDFIMRWARERAAYNTQKATSQRQRHPYEPAYLFESAIQPLKGYDVRGVLWYQGESNADNIEVHERLFPMLERSWREFFNQPNLPFHFVQLSSIDTRPSWPHFRDSQRRMAETLPNTYMAVCSDLGDSLDVHPRHKREVGERLAFSVLNRTYGHKVTPNGPRYQSMKIDGNAIILRFADAEGMRAAQGTRLIGFEVAGADGIYHPAEATIKNNTVIVRSKEVKQPAAARYGWQPFTRANLVNAAGLPASTFRTAAW
jgi:GDSL-like protein